VGHFSTDCCYYDTYDFGSYVTVTFTPRPIKCMGECWDIFWP
jgi:hypothetical protein